MEDLRISANTNKYRNVCIFECCGNICTNGAIISRSFSITVAVGIRALYWGTHMLSISLSFMFALFFFRLACRDFFIVALLLCCFLCCSLHFFFFIFWQITLINYFYQSGKWGQWQVPAVVPISPICLGLVCQLTIRFFSRALHFSPCFACLLFYSMVFYSVCRLMAWTLCEILQG